MSNQLPKNKNLQASIIQNQTNDLKQLELKLEQEAIKRQECNKIIESISNDLKSKLSTYSNQISQYIVYKYHSVKN